MGRTEWWAATTQNLGLSSLIRWQMQKRFGHFGPPGEVRLTSKHLKHPVYARRHTSDLYAFDQVLAAREYSCLDHLQSPSLIIDCGANVGFSSAYFLSRFPHCDLIAIEPDVENFSVLRKNVAPYGNRCRPIRAAVWPTKSSVTTIRSDEPNSEWGISVRSCRSDDLGAIETVTIRELIRSSPHARISILKIDIEGAEAELFRGETEWLDAVDNIVIELHGAQCEAAFFKAIEGRHFTISHCGELTVCLGRSDPYMPVR
jgi:FkbM family methyltransferase